MSKNNRKGNGKRYGKGNLDREQDYTKNRNVSQSPREKEMPATVRMHKTDGYTNDPEDYEVSPQITKDVASWAWLQPLGTAMHVDPGVVSEFDTPCLFKNPPAAMALKVMPTFGPSKSYLSPLNVGMNIYWQTLRKLNTSLSSYDGTDNIVYYMAADSAFQFHAWMVAVYGSLTLFSMQNRTIPRAIAELHGVNYDDLVYKMPLFRAYINKYALKLGSLAIPTVMPMFKTHYRRYLNIYGDMHNPKAQLYLYTPDGFWRYDETEGETGGKVVYTKLHTARPLDLDAIISYGDELTDNLLGSQDVGTISGDNLKVYGAEFCWTLPEMPENYQTPIVYAKKALDQIHNTTLVSVTSSNGEDISYVQNQEDPVHGPFMTENLQLFSTQYGASRLNHILDTDELSPDPRYVLDIVHFNVAPASVDEEGRWHTPCYSTELCVGLDWVVWNPTTNAFEKRSHNSSTIMWHDSSYVAELTQFDWHPIFWVWNESEGITGLFGDITNFRVTTYNDLKPIHDAATMAQMGIGRMGSKTIG